MIHLFNRRVMPFSKRSMGWPQNDLYCPHPFTNWSLNPGFLNQGRRLHTDEGFRRTADYDSLLQWLDGSDSLYVLGQSSAYCTNLLGLGQSWPDKLVGRFPGYKIVNGAVGGHSTYQSLIRFLAWGPVIKPRLTIVYTCKNDITPLKVSRPNEPNVAPDYQNLIAQYGMALAHYFGWRRPHIGLVFPDRDLFVDQGPERFNQTMLDGVLARYDSMADCARHWGGNVLFVSEVIRPSAYKDPMDRINDRLPELAERHTNAFVYDIRSIMPSDDIHFADKLHLTEVGCDVMASLLAEEIARRNLLRGSNKGECR